SFGAAGGLRSRIQTLLAVGQADLFADFRLRQFVEPREVLRCSAVIAGKLVCAGEAEFSGQMKRIQREALFKGRDRLIVTLPLHLKLAQKVQRVCVARIDPGDVLEGVDRRGGLSQRAVRDTEVVPGPRALRLTPCCIEKNVPRFGEL